MSKAKGRYVKGQGMYITLPNGTVVTPHELLEMKRKAQPARIIDVVTGGGKGTRVVVEPMSPRLFNATPVVRATPFDADAFMAAKKPVAEKEDTWASAKTVSQAKRDLYIKQKEKRQAKVSILSRVFGRRKK